MQQNQYITTDAGRFGRVGLCQLHTKQGTLVSKVPSTYLLTISLLDNVAMSLYDIKRVDITYIHVSNHAFLTGQYHSLDRTQALLWLKPQKESDERRYSEHGYYWRWLSLSPCLTTLQFAGVLHCSQRRHNDTALLSLVELGGPFLSSSCRSGKITMNVITHH